MSSQLATTENTNFEKILRSAMELPGVRINRATFLKKELSKYFDDDVVEKAIVTNPAQAGLSVKNLEQIAKACINYETAKVTALSAAAGVPGGFAMVATVPADSAQFFAHIIRVLQKMAYLYGWQEMFRDDNDDIDDGTSNQLTLFIGVMFGVNAANVAVSKIAALMAQNVPKQLMRQALTKGTIYPIVKQVAKMIGVKMTKEIFAKSVGKAIPVIGAVVSGGLTFAFFKPMSIKLRKYLATLPVASVDFYKNAKPTQDDDIIDVDFSDIDLSEEEIEISEDDEDLEN